MKKLYQALDDWDTAFTIYQGSSFASSLYFYERAYPILQKQGTFLMQYGKALSMAREHKKAIGVLRRAELHGNNTIVQTTVGDSHKALKQYGEAERAYLYAWYMSPGRFYPKYLLAKMYEETGKKQKVVAIAKELLSKKVKIESTAIQEIRTEMKRIIKESN